MPISAAIELATQEGVPDLVFHAITDGRDTSPTGGTEYLAELERCLRSAGRVGTVSGRYYAMDRDTRWDRVRLAYDAIVHGEGPRTDDPVAMLRDSYRDGITGEFVVPTVVDGYDGIADGEVAPETLYGGG